MSKITLGHLKGAAMPYLMSTDLRLEVSGNLDRSMYIDGKGLPRKEAMKPITAALVQGLLANIKQCHEKGWWKDHEHIRHIIDELQRGFVEPGTQMTESTMEY